MFDNTCDVWVEALGMPDALQRTLDDASGFADTADLLRGGRRIIATGNGAAYYAALTMDLAAQETPGAPDVKAVPAGVLSSGHFVWRDGDVLLAISSSGEQRDIIEAIEHGAPRPFATVTSSPDAAIPQHAGAHTLVRVGRQRAVTHTQAYVGNVAAMLALVADLAASDSLSRAVRDLPSVSADALAAAVEWVCGLDDHGNERAHGRGDDWVPTAAVAFGTGTAWAAALEAALLLKELAGIPAEGLETREGGTSGMFALCAEHLVLSLPTASDLHTGEVEQICARTDARVLRLPGGELLSPRVAAASTFPAALALAIVLARRRGYDVDQPAWTTAYEATTRTRAASSHEP